MRQLNARENLLLAYRHQQPEYVPSLLTDAAILFPNLPMERYAGQTRGKDGFGVEWQYEPSIRAPMPVPGQHLFTDITEWQKRLTIPDVEAANWAALAASGPGEDIHARFRAMSGLPDEPRAKVATSINGMFERMHACMGFENAYVALMTEPEACYDFFGAIADYKIAFFRKIAKYFPVDIINAHDDYGSADRMLISPDIFRRLLKPHLRRMVDACHELGILYQHHSCGYIEPILGDLVEIGVDAVDPLQACNRNLPELKRRYGRQITFCGGFDNQGLLLQPDVTEEQVRSEYRRVIDALAPGGSYVVHIIDAGKSMPYILDEHQKYGVPFYQRSGSTL